MMVATSKPARVPFGNADRLFIGGEWVPASSDGQIEVIAPARCPHALSKDARGGLVPWQLRRATQYMMEHLAGPVRLKDLAAQAGLSTSRFGRAFKLSMGISPHRWKTNLRVLEAQEMLRDGKQSQADVALATGFADQSHIVRTSGAGPEDQDDRFTCPSCGARLECRPTRRTGRAEKRTPSDGANTEPNPLTDAEMERCADEWTGAQEQLGNLGVMAESHWALDWADRLLADLRRLRGR